MMYLSQNSRMTRAQKYFRYFIPVSIFNTGRTKEILNVNPTLSIARQEPERVFVTVYDYDENSLDECKLHCVEDSFGYKENKRVSWINIDGLRKHDVDLVSEKFG